MSTRSVLGISGSVTRPSRTTALVSAVLDGITARTTIRPRLVELVDAAPVLFSALTADKLEGAAAEIVRAVEGADVLVVGTPVYRASYTGALKHLFDLVKGIWTKDNFNYAGKYYSANEFTLKPKPVQSPHPEIFQGGNSRAARENASAVSDWYFMNGNTPEGHKEQIDDVRSITARHDRTVRFGANAFIIARETEKEAKAELERIVAQADPEAVNAFGGAVKQAGQASPERKGMWQDSTFRDLISTMTASAPI
jgi:alkanesulfonate monooxygenase SsuD/methylene tetrahydromethanopterin reductase-like flavin-dependent oxidoreductase (luciferase family)